jgi:hypothetical protein
MSARSPAATATLGAIASVVASIAVSRSARADDVPVNVVDAVTSRTGAIVFVGSSGQLYEPAPENRWQRRGSGGVAGDVLAVVRASDDRLYAIGSNAPIYEWDGALWSARPLPNRGATTVSRGGAPAFSVGRHVYVLKSGAWERVVSTPRRISALWAQSATRMWIATAQGEIMRLSGKSWVTVAHPLPADDTIVGIFGTGGTAGAGNTAYAVARSGALLLLSGTAVSRVQTDGDLTRLDVHTAGLGGNGELLIAGMAGDGQARRAVLVSARGGKLTLADELWALPEGDRFSVVLRTGESALAVASRHGAVRVRGKDGGWVESRIVGELPNEASRRFQSAAPARAR